MPKGDSLASGGRSAQFQGAQLSSQLEHDLKVLPREAVMHKYVIGEERYGELIACLQAGQLLPDIAPVPEPVFMPAVGEIPEYIETIPVPEAERPTVGYRGKALGDNVLIQRVEKEHTSNLIIPDSMRARSDMGFVISIGSKVEKVQVGHLVCFDKFSAHGADLELIDDSGIERKYLLLREYDIMLELEKVTLE